MNIKTLKKIDKGRKVFPKFGVKKRGRNSFQKFNYYKLDDLIPVDLALCEKLNLSTVLNQENEECISLDVYDLDQDDNQEPVRFFIPACTIHNGNITQGSQEHGNVQTYSWRYLLYQLWNVSDGDEIDASEININTPIDEIKTDVPKERISELVDDIGNTLYKKGEDNKDKNVLMNELNTRLKNKSITNDEYTEVKKIIDKM